MSLAEVAGRDARTAEAAGRGTISGCLARLDEAIAAARTLGLPTDRAEAVRAEADERLGFGSDMYVLAFVGGTGVGKSSLLNALAGTSVSRASARRPTTDVPVAWVPSTASDEAAALIERLGIVEVRRHDDPALSAVAIVDLPDLDSVEAAHRERVEEILPRLDAVAWVTDPEKYHDAVLHDDFLRRWLPRLDRQLVVLNKADRLDPGDAERIRADLDRDLRGASDRPQERPTILLSTTMDGEAGLRDLRGWLEAEVEAKAVIVGRLGRAAFDAIESLARQAGVDPDGGARPMVPPTERRAAIDEATEAILRIIDLPALERQAEAATRARARQRGAGLIGRVTSLIYRASGREARVADPVGHLRRWRDRGSPVHAVEVLRAAANNPLRAVPQAVRPALAASTDSGLLLQRLGTSVDRVVAARAESRAPTSRLWPVIGLLQMANSLLLLFAVGWIVVWLLTNPPVSSVEVPIIGPVPMPYALLVLSLLIGLNLARLLALHAGAVGRRWARRLRADVRGAIEQSVADDAYAAVDRLEAARRALWIALRARSECVGR